MWGGQLMATERSALQFAGEPSRGFALHQRVDEARLMSVGGRQRGALVGRAEPGAVVHRRVDPAGDTGVPTSQKLVFDQSKTRTR